jgi:diguanylate cyclase (GGDEF)-like protein
MSEYKKTKTDEVPILNLDQMKQDQRPRHAYLFVLAGSAVGQMFRVEQEMVIGSGAKADIRLTGDGIGVEHCRLVVLSSGVVQLDPIDEASETHVNNELVQGPLELKDGDRLRLGASTLCKLERQDPLEEKLHQELRESSLQDSLTRLGNHEYMAHRLHTEYAFASRHEVRLSLCLLDLDGFVKVNESLGYPIGDQILQGVAKLVRQAARPEDICARPSGGTFAIIFLDMPIEEAEAAAEELRQRMARHTFEGAGFSISVTACFGVATFPHASIDSSQALLAAAREALAAAKQAGPNELKTYPD